MMDWLQSNNCGAMMRDYLPLAKKLFIELTDEFQLEFDSDHYRLKNKFSPVCHYLELCLISDKNMTGKKLKDICFLLEVNPEWVLGFYHAYKGKNKRYKDLQYIQGYSEGNLVKQKQNVQV